MRNVNGKVPTSNVANLLRRNPVCLGQCDQQFETSKTVSMLGGGSQR